MRKKYLRVHYGHLPLVTLVVLAPFASMADPVIITNDTTIIAEDMTYEHATLMVNAATLTVEGEHSFGPLSITNAGVLTVQGGDLAAEAMSINGSTCWLHNAASLSVTSAVSLVNNAVIWCEGANRTGKVDMVWAGIGNAIETSNLSVDVSSQISADGFGYWANQGPGGGGHPTRVVDMVAVEGRGSTGHQQG